MHENQSPVPLPRYRCHKVVEAAKIDSVTMTLVDDGAPTDVIEECRSMRWLRLVGVKDQVPVSAEWYDRHKVQPGGYFVRYADGYTSFSPAAAFEEGYSPVGPSATGALATLAGNLLDDPSVEGAVKDMARWVLGTIEAISPTQLRCDERDSLRHDLRCMEIQLKASTRAESELRQQLKAASDKRSEALVKQLDELRKECADLRQALAASPQAFDVLFKADMQEAMSGKRPPMEHAKLIDALARLSCCLPHKDSGLSDPSEITKKVAALIQKLRNENAEQSKALFDVSLAVEKIDGGASGTLQNLAPRIKRLGDRLAHAEREAPPTVAESEGFLAVAHDPGMWSQAADEFFVRKRIYRNHCPTPWVGMLWRHGPGVSNTKTCGTGSSETHACHDWSNH